MIEVYRFLKRVVDFAVSLISLVIFSPVLIILYLAILISSGWPVIFSAKRVGKDKRLFTVYKFRTLKKGLKRDEYGLSPEEVSNRLAKFMRDTHLDEVLQLINVVKGDMALIGPRPLDVPRYHHLRCRDHRWDHIFKAKPGMTCINQIARYSSKGMDKARKLKGLGNAARRNRLELDKYYIRNESLALDLKVTSWTLGYLVLGFFRKMFRKGELKA